MKKVYAKNPAEIAIINPSPVKVKKTATKDPRRVAAGRKAWKNRQQTTTKNNNMSKRVNPNSVAKTGKEMLVKYTLAAVGTIGVVRVTDYALQKFGASLPSAVKSYSTIVIPAVAGVMLATKAKKGNQLMQGVAGGMVYASVTQAFNKFLPAAVTGNSLSDAIGYDNSARIGASASNMSITPEGVVVDAFGNAVGNAKIAQAASMPALSDGAYSTSGWETQEESYGA